MYQHETTTTDEVSPRVHYVGGCRWWVYNIRDTFRSGFALTLKQSS
jgi:hypothetical protein